MTDTYELIITPTVDGEKVIDVPFQLKVIIYTASIMEIIYESEVIYSSKTKNITIDVTDYVETYTRVVDIILKPISTYESAEERIVLFRTTDFEYDTDDDTYKYYQSIEVSEMYQAIPQYMYRKREPGYSYGEEADSQIEYEPNKDLIIRAMNENIEVKCDYAKSLRMNMKSKLMYMENTDFIEHIKNGQDKLEIALTLGDVYENGDIVSHRDSIKEKLLWLIENNELVEIQSNITRDISIIDGNRTWMKNLIITGLEITQKNNSANTYECLITLTKLNFSEPELKYRYPRELGNTSIVDGEVHSDAIILTLTSINEKNSEDDENKEIETYVSMYEVGWKGVRDRNDDD